VHLVQSGGLRLATMRTEFGLTRATAQRDLAVLRKAGLIEFAGASRTGRYILTARGKSLTAGTKARNLTS
jgi:ATP-dependent DNA helicase RecG